MSVDTSGPGYLAGEYPGGTTTVEGVPQTATVNAYYELPSGDWQLAGTTTSSSSGTWQILNVNPDFLFHVLGRKAGHNDALVSSVSPTRTDVISITNSLVNNAAGTGVDGEALIVGGLPPYSFAVTDALPGGLTPVIDGHRLTIDGVSSAAGTWNSRIEILSSNLVSAEIEIEIVISARDEHWNKVAALLHFDGDAVDEKGNAWLPQNVSYAAGKFNDGVVFTRIAARSQVKRVGPELVLGSGDFSVEFFCKVNTSFNSVLFDPRPAQGSQIEPMIEVDGGSLYVWSNGSYKIGPFPGAIKNNTWHFIQMIRSSGTLILAVDGVTRGTASFPNNLTGNSVLLGASVNVASNNPNFDLQGMIDEFRITVGVARPIAVPTEPF